MKPYFVPLVLILSLTGGAVLLYVLLKRDDDDDDVEPAIYTAHQTVIKMKIPKEMVGVLIGREGENIKKIQQDSGARTSMDHHNSSSDIEYRVCTIYGSADEAHKAETLIHEFLMRQPKIETFEMTVDQRYCGRIIGRGGSNMRHIRTTSHAKIILSDEDDCYQSKITIKGTSDQIAIARDLILNTIAELDLSLEELQDSIQNRSPRVKPKIHLNGVPKLPPNSDSEMLVPPGGDKSLEVFVSAMVNPEQLWVQVISEKGTKLDKLVDDMTNYYNSPGNPELHKLSELNEQQVVAAVFAEDGKWYRAEIVTVIEQKEEKRKVEVLYLDYGDSGVVDEDQVLELSTDFLTLRFQAIECFLFGIKPKNETWPDEAVDLFEALTHVALWQKMTVVIKTYEERDKSPNKQIKRLVPGIELFDTQGKTLINVGEELVKAGFAEKTVDWDSLETEDPATNPSTSTLGNQFNGIPELSDSDSDIDGFYVES